MLMTAVLALAVAGAAPAPAQAPTHSALAAPPSGSAAPRLTALGCALSDLPGGTVTAVPDGRSLKLADGREVLLAGIEVAPVEFSSEPAAGSTAAVATPGNTTPPPTTAAGAQPSPGAEAREKLAALVRDREVVLRQGAPQPDRWNRLVAWGFVDGDRPLQRELLAQGLARVAARVDDTPCMPALRTAEREARKANLGLWSDPVYAALSAEQPAEILKRRGRFAVIVGRVDSVRESGGTIYVNFGRRWSEAFAGTIPKRIERTLQAAGLDPRRLAGRRVELRGIVEQRGGPRIEILRAEQLAIEGH
ncbi:MAG: thermonuclease family protein [Rhodoplanes sp.]|nr:thermonuclease family protein [Rhodoplanes sp.]